MTREEAIKLLNNTKVFVKNKSEEIQEKLFDIGFNWNDKQNKEVKYTNSPFLFIYDNRMLKYSNDVNWFYNNPNKEVTAEDILSITIEPKYRPFKSQEECWQEMHKHPDFGWIVSKNGLEFCHICDMFTSTSNSVMITLGIDQSNPYKADTYFNNYTFADGTPFGIKED